MSVGIPLFTDLIPGGVPYRTAFVIEYDADSSYYQILESTVHDLLNAGQLVSFFDYTRFPDQVRQDLKVLGSDIDALEAQGRFHLYDGYSATLGVKSKEKLAFESLKAADVSLYFLKMTKDEHPIRNDVGFSDNGSISLRYNDEKTFLDFYATRVIPRVKLHDRISFTAFVSGVHSAAFYKSIEDICDGVIDVKFDDSEGTPRTKLRIRAFKLGQFNGSWRHVKFDGLHATLTE
jgi:KaiC/GvpD/RAD55 family RecA-like ATPase